jgi:hypothetical protein
VDQRLSAEVGSRVPKVAVGIRQLGPQVWEQRLTVSAAVPDVFGYLLDFERHPEWELELQAVKLTHGRSGGAGAVYVKTYGKRPPGRFQRMFSSPLRATCKVTAVEPPARLAWKQHLSHRAAGPSSFQNIEMVVSPCDSGSLLVVTRELVGSEGAGVDLASAFSTRFGDRLQALSAGAPGTAADLSRYALDGFPSRGPGPTSLERLEAVFGPR